MSSVNVRNSETVPENEHARFVQAHHLTDHLAFYQIHDIPPNQQSVWVTAVETNPSFKISPPSNETITSDQLESIHFAITTLNIPVIVAGHAVLNQGLNQQEMVKIFGIPNTQEPSLTTLLSGPASVGKSALARRLELEGWTVVNFDIFTQDQFSLPIDPNIKQKSFSSCMDLLCQKYHHCQRPKKLLIDNGGFHIDQPLREADIFDDFMNLSPITTMPWFTASESSIIGEPVPTSEFTSVLNDYVDQMKIKEPLLFELNNYITQAIVCALKHEYAKSSEEYFKWVHAIMESQRQDGLVI